MDINEQEENQNIKKKIERATKVKKIINGVFLPFICL